MEQRGLSFTCAGTLMAWKQLLLPGSEQALADAWEGARRPQSPEGGEGIAPCPGPEGPVEAAGAWGD